MCRAEVGSRDGSWSEPSPFHVEGALGVPRLVLVSGLPSCSALPYPLPSVEKGDGAKQAIVATIADRTQTIDVFWLTAIAGEKPKPAKAEKPVAK